jgi:hypothetical protein
MKLGAPIDLTEEELAAFEPAAPPRFAAAVDLTPAELAATAEPAAPTYGPPIDPLDDFEVFNAIEDDKEQRGYDPADPGIAASLWAGVKDVAGLVPAAGRGLLTFARDAIVPGGAPKAVALGSATAGRVLGNASLTGQGIKKITQERIYKAAAVIDPTLAPEMKQLSRRAAWDFAREARDTDAFVGHFNDHLETLFPEALAGLGAVPVDQEAAQGLAMVADPANFIPAGGAAQWVLRAPLRGAVRAASSTVREASLAAARSAAAKEAAGLALRPGLSAAERGPLFARYQQATAANAQALARKEVATKVLARTAAEQRATIDSLANEAAQQPLLTRGTAAAAEGLGNATAATGRGLQALAGLPDQLAAKVAGGADAGARQAIADGVRNVAGLMGAVPASLGATGVAAANVGRNLATFGRVLAEAEGQLPFFKRLARETDGLASWSASLVDQSGLGAIVVPAARVGAEASRGLPFSAALGYAGAGGDTEAAARAVGGGLVFGLAGGAYGQWRRYATGDLFRQQQLADVARFRGNLASDEARSHFDRMPAADRAGLATMQLAHPDLQIKYEQLGEGRPSFYYAAEDGPVAIINLDTKDGINAVVAHEIGHHVERHGLGSAVERVLFGDPFVEQPGIFTERDRAGAPVLAADGGYARNAEWTRLRDAYQRRLDAHAERTGETIPPRDDAAMAREVFAEHAADYLLGRDGALRADLRSTAWSPVLERLAGALVATAPAARQIVGKLGIPLRSDRQVVGSGLFPGGLAASGDLKALVRDYTRRSARGRPDPIVDEPAGVKFTQAEVVAHPQILDHLFDGSDDVARDARGRVLRDKEGRPRFLAPKEQQAQRQALAAAITAEIEKAPPPGAKPENDATLGPGWTIPGLPAAVVDRLAGSGKFNPAQLAHLREVSTMIQQGAGNSALFFYQPAMNARKQYASLAGDWRTETPYQIFVSKAGNVLFRTASREKLMANAQEMIAKKRGGLWENNLPALVRDIDTYLANHAASRSGAEGIGLAKRDAINSLFGINTKANAAANPFKETAPKAPIVIRSRRLDRTNRLTAVDGTFPTNYDLLNRNFRPEGEGAAIPPGLEQLATALPAAIVRAGGSSQAETAAQRFLNQPLANLQTSIPATVSGESLRKMLSASSARRSVSPEAHYTAVANLDQLYPVALRAAEARPDRKGDRHLQAIHRFDAPLPLQGKVYRAKMLVKEFTNPEHGTRIYNVEAVEIAKPASYGGDANTGETGSKSLPPAGFDRNFARLAELVNRPSVPPDRVLDQMVKP